MIWLGIPRYRLPKDVIQREVDMILDVGVEIQYNTAFGCDTDFERLRAEGFEAFFFAIGAHQAMRLRIPGEDDFPDVLQAVEFLREMAMARRQPPGRKVVVIGGGNVAIDAARTCVRLGCESVTIAYRRTRAEMPADEEEIIHALEEGIELLPLTVPVAVKGTDERVTALQCLKAKLVEREGSVRKYPVPIEGSDYDLETDCIISAIGQRIESDCLGELSKLEWTRWNTISVDEVSMQTSIEGVFAAGDAVTGPATVVEAIGGGKRAARAIHRHLTGLSQSTVSPVPARRSEVEVIALGASEKQDLQRPEMPMVDVATRIKNFDEVELGFDEAAARAEAGRCLRCDICRRCGLCVEICRDQMGVEALELGFLFGGGKDHPTDLTKTNDKCIGCGACAVNCTNDAMQIHDQSGQRVLRLCGTELSRQDLVACEECGVVIGTHRYVEFVQKRLGDVPAAHGGRLLCEACSRASAVAHLQVGIPS
jgi:NADPH-dependent glutamate synthase beta subunit-like oxidoreductase